MAWKIRSTPQLSFAWRPPVSPGSMSLSLNFRPSSTRKGFAKSMALATMVPPGGEQYRLQVSEGTLMVARKWGARLVVLTGWAATAAAGRAGADTRQVVIAPAYKKGG